MMDLKTKAFLLAYFNTIWRGGEAPESWKEAVIIFYKGKGTHTDPATSRNYRPISLLSAIYKLFADMLQSRQCNMTITLEMRNTDSDHNAVRDIPSLCSAKQWNGRI